MKPLPPVQRLVADRISQSIAVHQSLLRSGNFPALITRVARTMIASLRSGRKILFFGNGGSAADAQHLAAELAGRYLLDRPALAAMALTTNSSSLTAIANDYGFERIFSRQLEALGRPGDVAVAISTSGNSSNVLRAAATARAGKMRTVGMTGGTGGKLKPLVDVCLCVDSDEPPRIQEAHILIGHILCELIEQECSPKTRRKS
jgi:D-sedoheptulose 7-phosphate isomerase